MSDESDSELPLPMSPPTHARSASSSSSSSSSSRSRSSDSDMEKDIPSPPSPQPLIQKEDTGANLDEIPYPAEMEVEDIEIPLPPDSSKYSPSQTLVAGDDDVTSPSDSLTESKKTSTTVLGKAQAKKRLLAFSVAKLNAVASSTVKKPSPTKASLLQRQQQQHPQPQRQQLAIEAIKEDEIKMKEMLAMNSALKEKLKQVNIISTNIPTQPPATAIVKPTLSNTFVETMSKPVEVVSESVAVTLPATVEVAPIPLMSISTSMNPRKEKHKSSRHLRKTRRSTGSSRSHSRSHSRSRSVSKSRSRSVDRDRRRNRYGGKLAKHGRRSKSASRSRSKSKEKDRSGKEKDGRGGGASKSYSRRTPSRSRSKERERKKDKEVERVKSTKESKDRDRERKRKHKEIHRKKSRSRSFSPDIRPSKQTSKDREREAREKEREERNREKEKAREREKEKERERQERKDAERKAEKELDKVRKARLPTTWADFREFQYRTEDVKFVWNMLLERSVRSRSRSDSRSPDRILNIVNPTPLSRSLTYHSKDARKTIHIEGRILGSGLVDYPATFNRRTKTKPSITYGITPLCYDGLYKSRDTIFGEEDPDIVEAMKDIISLKPSKENIALTLKTREWFAASEHQFCPSDGGKGVLISHLYSDDDQSRENSPLFVKDFKSESSSQKTKSKLVGSNVESGTGSRSRSVSPDNSVNDSDSAPSPLLKRKYNNDDSSSFILEKESPVPKATDEVVESERKKHHRHHKSRKDKSKKKKSGVKKSKAKHKSPPSSDDEKITKDKVRKKDISLDKTSSKRLISESEEEKNTREKARKKDISLDKTSSKRLISESEDEKNTREKARKKDISLDKTSSKRLVSESEEEKNTREKARKKDISLDKTSSKRLISESEGTTGHKGRDKVKKKKREKEKKPKRKRSKRAHSTSSAPESSEESDSEESSKSSSSDDSSGNEGKKQKSKKKKSLAKKRKAKDRSPPTSDDEKGGGRQPPPGGSGGGSGRSSNAKPDKDNGGRDRHRESGRDRDRGNDRGKDRSGKHRRRNIDIDGTGTEDREEGELTTETSDFEGVVSKAKERPYLTYPPIGETEKDSQEQEEIRKQSMNPENPNPNPSPAVAELIQVRNVISDSEKDTHTLLSEFDDDPFLQSILENKDLSAEALLEKISTTNPNPTECVEKRVVVTIASTPNKPTFTSWSDDSEDDTNSKGGRSCSTDRTSVGNASDKGHGEGKEYSEKVQADKVYVDKRSRSRSRSRSPRPRSHRREREYAYDRKRERDYSERSSRRSDRDRDRERYFSHHSARHAVIRGRLRYYGHSYHQHHRYGRRSPPPYGHYDVRSRYRRDRDLDDKLHEEGRRHVEDREKYEKFATVGPGPRTPTGDPPTEVIKDSPPLQLNVADSTISDSELAMASGNVVFEISTIDSSKNRGGNPESELSKFDPDENYGYGFASPPRRLSLDERLEMEMGISLRDEPPNHFQYNGPPNFCDGFGQSSFPPLPHQLKRGKPNESEWNGVNFKKPGQNYRFRDERTQSEQEPFHAQGAQAPRTQSQIVQVGNVIQVVPAELPSTPITISSSASKAAHNGPSHLIIGASKQVPNRVVTIKVPVVPFTIPMIAAEDMPAQSDEQPTRKRSKPAHLKRRRPTVPKEDSEERTVVNAVRTEKDKEMGEPDEIISEEEIALLKEAMSTTLGESENDMRGADELQLSQKIPEEQDLLEETLQHAQYIDDMDDADEAETVAGEPEGDEDEKSDNQPRPSVPLRPRPLEILPAPAEGILVAVGWDKTGRQRKSVKFADGVNPGYGTSPSGGEEMASPPPPSCGPQKKSLKQKALAKKKKIRVKIVRKGDDDEMIESSEPPPFPSGPYPFCPPGILYQVCPQYAVLYAQAVAEKGFDIVFEASTQLPYMAGGEEISSKPINTSQPKQDESPLRCNAQSPHFSPFTNLNSSGQDGSRIPTIMNRQTMNISSPLDMHPLNSLQLQVNAIPYYSPQEQDCNTKNVHHNSLTMENLNEIREPSPEYLDAIPLPNENPNNIYISPSKIPMPSGIPSNKRRRSSGSHSRSISPEKPKTKKKAKLTGKERKMQKLLRAQQSHESISIPLAKIVSNNALQLHGGPNEFSSTNRFVEYDFTPYNMNIGIPGPTPAPCPAPISLPLGIDINRPPPSVIPITPSSRLSPGASAASTVDTQFLGKDIVSVLPPSGLGHYELTGEAVGPSLGLNVPTTTEELDDTGEETPPPPGTTP